MKQLLITIAALVLVGTAFADPLHDAASKGDLAGVQAELDKGVDVDTKDDNGLTPLQWAALEGHKEIVELLIDTGANVNAWSKYGTPLHYAASGGYKEIVELLIAKGADVNVKDVRGETALQKAASGGHKGIAELLIANGAKVNAKDNWDQTILHWVAGIGHKEIAELLIANGAKVNAKDELGETPLDWTRPLKDDSPEVKANKKETADLISKHGGKSGAADSIFVAAAVGNVDAVKQHLADGVDVGVKDESLHLAAWSGHKEIVELLIAEGADVNVKDCWGTTPLHEVTYIWSFNDEIATLLIAAGADINAKDGEGGTPLDNVLYTIESWIMWELWGETSIGEEALKRANELVDFLRANGGRTSDELLMPHLVQHGRFAFSFNTFEGVVYEIQDSPNLKDWETVKTYTGTNRTVRFDEERDHHPPQCFYRVRVVE